MLKKYRETNLLMEQIDSGYVRTAIILNSDSVLESYMSRDYELIETEITPIDRYFHEEGYGYNNDGAWNRKRKIAKEILPKRTNITKKIFSNESVNVSMLSGGDVVITTQDGMTLVRK